MNQLLGLGFAVLLAGFTAASYFHKDTAFSDTENRMLQQKPVFSWADLADGRFMGNFEKYQTDQFILRREWIGLQTAADRLLGKNKSGDVYLGEGQLLEEPSKLSENVWENLDAIGAFCRNRTRRRYRGRSFRRTRRWRIRRNSWRKSEAILRKRKIR